ncbi:LysE family translocator [Metabacillus herbersteinensis]|uniref:LysE family translocator n=1 Tax=Metabacillus herbersteinensis TaxID=283816 RepID=A0ABV6GB03_9BACI
MEFVLTFIHYIVLGLSLAAPIGPMNVEVIKRGLSEGFYSSWLVGLGGLTGDVIVLLSIFFGLSEVMANPFIKIAMYIVGIIMLCYLGITSVKSAFSRDFILYDDQIKTKSKNAYLAGFVIALANPIGLIFWFGVFGTSLQVLTSSHSMIFSILCSFAIIIGLFLWNLNLVFTVHFSKKIMNEKVMRGMTFFAGVCLMSFGAHFVMELAKLLL